MLITPLKLNLSTPQNVKHENNYPQNRINYFHSQPAKDEVSFSGKLPKVDNTFFSEALGRSYDAGKPKFIAIAREFHASLKRVAAKLQAYGFTYDDAYNTAHPVKTKASFLDKSKRQGSVQDIIRGTVYWQDQQDIPAFKKFLEEMKKEGWEIAPLRKRDPNTDGFVKNKRGSIIKFPDLEIRQNGITAESLAPLGEFLQRAEISKPRSSTYADWQMRFISTKEKGMREGRQDCEVIFLYGPHYKDAKEIEHTYVFEPWRKLRELHVDMNPTNHQKNSSGFTIAENVSEIHKRLVQFVSHPLFTNAYNADLKNKNAIKLPVEISNSYCNLIMNYAKSIEKALKPYYKEKAGLIAKDEQVAELIKQSPAYLIREDKNISAKEIKDKRAELKEYLDKCQQDDIALVREVRAMLQKTIDKFGLKD